MEDWKVPVMEGQEELESAGDGGPGRFRVPVMEGQEDLESAYDGGLAKFGKCRY